MNDPAAWSVEWHERGVLLRRALDGRVRFGRAPTNEIVLDDAMASREHGVISIQDGVPHVDCGAHEVRIEGRPVHSAALGDGALFMAGSTTFRVSRAAAALVSAQPWCLSWRINGEAARMLVDRPITIGRASDNDIVLVGRSVSRRHAILSPGPDALHVDASESGNLIQVGGNRVARAALRDGQSFAVADTSFAVARGVGAGSSSSAEPLRRRPALAIAGAAAAAVAAVALGLVLLTLGGGGSGGEAELVASADGYLLAVDGSEPTLETFDPSWREIQSDHGFSVRMPRGWSSTSSPTSLRFLPPDDVEDGHSPAIAFTVLSAVPYSATAPIGRSVSAPEPITVGGVEGRAYKDLLAGIPTHGYTIELPLRDGTLSIYATTGPVTNLMPQLLELLKGVTILS